MHIDETVNPAASSHKEIVARRSSSWGRVAASIGGNAMLSVRRPDRLAIVVMDAMLNPEKAIKTV